MTVDAVIVGSGPAGSTVADVLTEAGWSVVIFEKGRNHLIDLAAPDNLLADYSNDEIKFVNRHFLGPDPLIEPKTFRTGADQGDHSHVGEVNTIPSTVGGGGVHADGKTPRFREVDFRLLSELGPQTDADVADWPVELRRARALLREGRKEHRRRRARRSEPLRGVAVGSLSDAPWCSDVRSHALVSSCRAPRISPLSCADGRQLRSLRRQAGVQQLRFLCLLRVSDPRKR